MKNKKQLQVGKTYRATDTGNVFVATEADVKGATLANSTHLYEEVTPAPARKSGLKFKSKN